MTQVTTAHQGPRGPLPAGIGLGLRWAFLEEALTADLPQALAFFELSPENYMRRGGYFPEALQRVAARRPLRSHGLMLDIGGRDPLDHAYLRQLRDFLERFGFDHHSDHLCWSRSQGRYLHELLPLAWTRAEARRIAARIQEVSDILERPLAVENISYYADVVERVDPRREAAFVTEVVEQADCGLLLDVNNVAINAENFGFDAWDLITALPLGRVQSLHVAGGQRLEHFEGRLIDNHGSDVNDEVRELMARVVSTIGPCPVLYERDNELPEFASLCRQVDKLDRTYQEALARRTEHPPAPEAIELRDTSTYDADLVTDYFLTPEAEAAPEGLPPEQAALYRRLVRGALRQPLFAFLERSAARLGDTFEAWVEAWLEAGGSRSPYLRDLPDEFFAWVDEHYGPAQGLEAAARDLMRHELIHYRISSAVNRPPEDDAPGLALDRPLHFTAPAERIDYEHAVHELSADLDDRSPPPPRPCRLLVYRDPEHIVRYLELSEFAAGLVDRLIEGESVEGAMRGQLGISEGPLPDEKLADAGRLLHELTTRAIVHGG